MTIAEIVAARNALIRPTTALDRLGLPRSRKAGAWLASRLQAEIANLPHPTLLYRLRDVDRLKAELDRLDSIPRRKPTP